MGDEKPIWFYCSQTVGTHCQKGMVGSINAPTTGNTLDAFIQLASNATQSTAPPGGAVGGVLKVAGGSGNGSASSYTTSTYTSVTTSAVIATYTNASTTYASTIGTSTIYSTGATVIPAPSGPVQIPAGSGASGRNANLLGVVAIILGAIALI